MNRGDKASRPFFGLVANAISGHADIRESRISWLRAIGGQFKGIADTVTDGRGTMDKPRRCSPSRRAVRSLDPKRPIEGPILDGFADVLGGDAVGSGEIGDGAGDFEDAVVGAGAEV
jgi:hypothetical protein